jgi:glutamate-1-semialdehyde 2,1-aminomutase
MNRTGEKIRGQIKETFEVNGVDVQVTGVSSLFNAHFTGEEVKDTRAVFRADRKKLAEYHLNLIANGVFFSPTHMGALSTAHSEADMQKLLSETEKYAKLCGK